MRLQVVHRKEPVSAVYWRVISRVAASISISTLQAHFEPNGIFLSIVLGFFTPHKMGQFLIQKVKIYIFLWNLIEKIIVLWSSKTKVHKQKAPGTNTWELKKKTPDFSFHRICKSLRTIIFIHTKPWIVLAIHGLMWLKIPHLIFRI